MADVEISTPAENDRRVELILTDTLRIQIQEGSSTGELGCRLWMAATMLAGALRRDPSCVEGLDVLEIGAGVGAVGFTAAALGARKTTIADCGPETMFNLAKILQLYQIARGEADPCDSEEVEDNFIFDAVTQGTTVSLRRHLWEEDLECVSANLEKRPMDRIQHWSKVGAYDQIPSLAFNETFDVVLGSDLLYFSSQEEPLLAAIRLRLRPNGVALILQTMRTNNVSVFRRFIQAAEELFQVDVIDVRPEDMCVEVTRANETPHTTGYKFVTLKHMDNKPLN